MNTPRTALVIGATGLIGNQLVQLLLTDPAYSKVTVIVRRPFFKSDPKLTEIIFDFDRLADCESHFAVDDIFCCLGTNTKETPDQAIYRKIDVEYPLAAARSGKKMGAKQYFIVTAVNANPKSRIAFLRMKGEVQEQIKALGFDALHIFQPSLIAGRTEKKRLSEDSAIWIVTHLKWLYPKAWQKYLPVEGGAVAQAMQIAAKAGKKGVFVHTRPEILALIQQNR